ncbi:MAG TPA: hypothetical protein VLL75_09000, partial [Vicinamibacteria bacterium]|nr:hypothetical protein [Vicinamibacteria bacterium]
MTSPPPAPRLGVAISVVTMATASAALAVQILAHRMISAKLLNNYAFLVISLTMLGFAASGVLLTPRLGRVLADRSDHLARFAALFVLSFVAAAATFYHAPAGSQFVLERREFVMAQLSWAPLALFFALPFTFAGLILGTLLADPRLPARRVYGVDLIGSAAGAVVVVPLIRWIGVERGALLVCGAFLAAVVAALAPRRPSTVGLAGAAAAALVAGWAAPDTVFPLRVRPASTLVKPVSESGPGLEYMQWDPVARIEISRIPPPDPETTGYASLIGGNPRFLARFHRVLTQNDYAFAYMVHYDGRPESLRGIEETIYAAAYHVRAAERPRVLTIGVGGGFDVLTALAFDASRVVGVEVNGATLDVVGKVYRDYCQAWAQDPRVELVKDDGRHYLAGTEERFDVIQLSGVDSYSGTPAAAHVFSENFLYTAEAFDLYLSRLGERGILNVMRLEFSPQREMLRALATAVEALRRNGVAEPRRHLVTVSARRNNFTAVLVKRTPFTAEEVARVQRWADGNPYVYVAASPFGPPPPPNMYAHFLGLGTPERERAFMAAYPFEIVPATDDRPFFFNYARWDHLWSRDESVRRSLPAMQITTVLLLGVIGTAAAACVYLPLRMVEARPRR